MSEADTESHIAWDIGAAGVTEILSDQLRTPAILCGVSRLVIDCNRRLDSPALVLESSHGTAVPGNVGIDAVSREARIKRWFRPYHDIRTTAIDLGGNKKAPSFQTGGSLLS